MNPHIYAHLIFDKAAINICWIKDSSSTNVAAKVVVHLQKTEAKSMFFTLY
jgi:hypothetical protein